MASVTIRLNSIGEVKEFNRIAATVPGDVDLHSGLSLIHISEPTRRS